MRLFPAAQAVAGAVAVRRIAAGRTRLPPVEPEGGGAAGCVTVVIPARDEERRIGPCIEGVVGDPLVAEVVVVDDESTDATAAAATRLGARVVPGRPLPAGWVGKPWALHQGLASASTPWVLFLDADTRPRPGLVGAALRAAGEHRSDLVSLGGRFVCETRGQQVLHPSMLATLLYRFGPVGPRRRPAPGRTVANGQCILVRREWLAARSGFEPVRDHMTDDIALVRHLATAGAAVDFLDGSRVLDVEMYESGHQVWREWGRSLAMPDVTPPLQQAADLAVVWLAMALPLPRLLLRRATPLDVALLVVRLGLVVATAGAYRPPRRWVALAPLADVAVAIRLSWSALRPTRRWRGRTYAR